MTSGCALMFLGVAANCTRPAPATLPAQPNSTPLNVPSAASAGPVATPSHGRVLERQASVASPRSGTLARVTIHNSYLITQYVFIDEIARATLVPRSEQTFEVAPGAHSIAVSDSNNREQNAHYVAEVFDAGFDYRYDVVTR